MAKRVLSLLLALVMALSLCVPAFAAEAPVDEADEVGAEAVEEVVDEAAAEPEAEPAEEPAEEPVDVPAEAAVDEPETAAVDEPMLVALGVVTKDSHYKLKTAVDAAEALLAAVQAGTVRMGNWPSKAITINVADYIKDPVENDPFKGAAGDFEKDLEEAQKCLQGVDGIDVGFDVTTTKVETCASNLAKYVSTDESKLTEGCEERGTASAISYLQKTVLEGFITDNATTGADPSASLSLSSISKKTDVTKDPTWQKAFQANYLTALQKAISAVVAYDQNTATFADFKAVTQTILDALVLRDAAAKPASSDMAALNAAIAKAENALEDYDPDAYALGEGKATIERYLKAAEDLKATGTSSTNDFDHEATYWDFNEAVDNINNALEPKGAVSIAFETYLRNSDTTKLDVTVSVKAYEGSNANKANCDGHTYGIAYQVQKKNSDEALWFPAGGSTKGVEAFSQDMVKDVVKTEPGGYKTKWTAGGTDYPGKYTALCTIDNIGDSASEPFVTGDKVIIHFYEKIGTGEVTSWKELKSVTITVADNAVDWPEIDETSISVTAGSIAAFANTDVLVGDSRWSKSGAPWTAQGDDASLTTITIKLDKKVTEGELASKFDWQVVVKVGKNIVATVKDADITELDSETITITDDDAEKIIDKYLAAGDSAVIELQSTDNNTATTNPAWTTRATAKLEVDALSEKWTPVATIAKVLKAAEALDEGDYELAEDDVDELKEDTVAEAFGLIRKDIALIKANITSTTLADTVTNHNATGGLLNELIKVCGYLKVKTSDQNEFKDLLAEANEKIKKDKVNEGEGGYTYDSIGKLKELFNKYKTGITAASLQSEVDDAVAALKAALAALTEEGEVDKSELEAAVAQAKALNEDDYTEDSWTALQNQLTAAEAVLADEEATQAEVNGALATLQAALEGMEKKPATKEDLQGAIDAAEDAIADPDKYTEESVKAVEDAIAEAEKVVADETATDAEIGAAIEALESAVKGLTEPEEPEIPEAPKGGTGWVQAEDGTYYYYKNNAVVKGDWVKSKGLWYYMDAEGKLLTGLNEISDKYGKAWYFFEDDNSRGTEGRMLTGWVELENAEGAGDWGWFETRSNGHQGQCTYTSTWGDFDGYTKK